MLHKSPRGWQLLTGPQALIGVGREQGPAGVSDAFSGSCRPRGFFAARRLSGARPRRGASFAGRRAGKGGSPCLLLVP